MSYKVRKRRGTNLGRQIERLSNMGVKGGSSRDGKCKHRTSDRWAMKVLCEVQC